MDCRDIHQLLAAGAPPAGPEAEAHLATCAACRELADEDGRLGRILASAEVMGAGVAAGEAAGWNEDLAALADRTVAAVEADRGLVAWAASRATWMRWGMVLGAAALAVLGALVLAPREDFAVHPGGRMVLAVTSLVAALVAAAGLALRPLHRAPPSPTARRLSLAAALLTPLLLAALPQAHALLPVSLEGVGDAFVPRAARCFAFGWATGLPALVVARLADRRRRPTWTAVLLAAAVGGLAGNLALQMHCPITHPEHLLAGHASVSVAMVAVFGLLLLRRR